ncbi:MAG: squalene synthase HpnC [Planctomycetota bacterium]|nr:squalene synthase HpnC [Planctomycetota bacterium]
MSLVLILCVLESLLVTTESLKNPAAAPAVDPLALAAQHYENFPVGSWLLPKAARRHLHRIYAFARTADDLADELRDAAALASFRRDFFLHLDGACTTPLFVDLASTIRECALPVILFTDLLDAFAQDLVVGRYDEPALFDYCRRSADPVGRLVLRVSGYSDARLMHLSDKICTALQLLNHLQDIGADLHLRDRIYFPSQDLARFGVTEAQLRAPHANPAVRALVLYWADRIAELFVAGWPLIQQVRGRLRLELRAILRAAAAVLAMIRRAGGDVLGVQVKLSKRGQLGALLGGLVLRGAPDFGGGK